VDTQPYPKDPHVLDLPDPSLLIICTDPDNPANVSEDSDPYQNVRDPEHWLRHTNIFVTKIFNLIITLIESSRLPADSTSSITSAPKPRAITLRAMSSGDTASQQ
jgi:hypothetical protein